MSILGWWGICAGVLLVAAGLLGAWVRNKPGDPCGQQRKV